MPLFSGDKIIEFLSDEFTNFKRTEANSVCFLQLRNEVRFVRFCFLFSYKPDQY